MSLTIESAEQHVERVAQGILEKRPRTGPDIAKTYKEEMQKTLNAVRDAFCDDQGEPTKLGRILISTADQELREIIRLRDKHYRRQYTCTVRAPQEN